MTNPLEFVVAADRFLEVGWNGNAAKLVAVASAASPLVFRREQDAAGVWNGILVRDTANADSRLKHVHIVSAGKPTRAALCLDRAIGVTQCSFSKSLGFGILKDESDPTAYEDSNTFTENAAGAVGTL